MTSIIKQIDALGLKYTFASSGADSGTTEEDAIKSSFYSQTNQPSYWQITFPQLVTAGSYQFCPSSPSYSNYVESWNVSFSNGSSFTYIQTNSVSSKPSGAVKFSFSKPISFRSFRITSKRTNRGSSWIRVGQFDLFAPIGAKNRATIDYGLRKQRKIRNLIILMMMQLITC